MVWVYITVCPPPWPAFFATSHHSLDIDAFYIQSHLLTKNRVNFFAMFVNRLRGQIGCICVQQLCGQNEIIFYIANCDNVHCILPCIVCKKMMTTIIFLVKK